MSSHPNTDDPQPRRDESLRSAATTARLIDQLPSTMTTLPLFSLVAGNAGHPWEITITLTGADQATLDTLRLSRIELCRPPSTRWASPALAR